MAKRYAQGYPRKLGNPIQSRDGRPEYETSEAMLSKVGTDWGKINRGLAAGGGQNNLNKEGEMYYWLSHKSSNPHQTMELIKELESYDVEDFNDDYGLKAAFDIKHSNLPEEELENAWDAYYEKILDNHSYAKKEQQKAKSYLSGVKSALANARESKIESEYTDEQLEEIKDKVADAIYDTEEVDGKSLTNEEREELHQAALNPAQYLKDMLSDSEDVPAYANKIEKLVKAVPKGKNPQVARRKRHEDRMLEGLSKAING